MIKAVRIFRLPLLFCGRTQTTTNMSNEQTPSTNNNDIIADHVDGIRQIELEGYELDVKKARNALFWVAGLVMFWELISVYRETNTIELSDSIFPIIVALLFIGLALWTKNKPYTALVTGIILFTLYRLLGIGAYGIAYGMEGIVKALLSGIIITVIIYYQLFRSLKQAKELQQAKEEQQKQAR